MHCVNSPWLFYHLIRQEYLNGLKDEFILNIKTELISDGHSEYGYVYEELRSLLINFYTIILH